MMKKGLFFLVQWLSRPFPFFSSKGTTTPGSGSRSETGSMVSLTGERSPNGRSSGALLSKEERETERRLCWGFCCGLWWFFLSRVPDCCVLPFAVKARIPMMQTIHRTARSITSRYCSPYWFTVTVIALLSVLTASNVRYVMSPRQLMPTI